MFIEVTAQEVWIHHSYAVTRLNIAYAFIVIYLLLYVYLNCCEKRDDKYLESFWNAVLAKGGEDQLDQSVKNENMLHGVKEERKIRNGTKRRKSIWIGHVSHMNCPLNHVIEDK